MSDRINLRIKESPSGGPLFEVECGGLVVSFGKDRQLSADAIVRMFRASGLDPDLSSLPVEVEAEPGVDWTDRTAAPSLVLHDTYDLVDTGAVPGQIDLVPGRREGKLEFKLHGHPDQLQKIALEIQSKLHDSVRLITLRQCDPRSNVARQG